MLRDAEVTTDHYPPLAHSLWWLALAGGCLLAIVGVVFLARYVLRRIASATDVAPPDLTDQLRQRALADLDALADQVATGQADSRQAHLVISAILRRFVGTVTDTNVDFEGLAELREQVVDEPRLAVVASVVDGCYGPVFDPAAPTVDPAATIGRARKVLNEWR